jgi:DNA N-6-adenine-methyltransferase (Dam)
MAEHEPGIGLSDDWHTPREIFAALGLRFDLDPCAPTNRAYYWVPANRIYTKDDDGLRQSWHGLVFMNPPFGGRRGHVPWLRKFLAHGNGVAIVRAYTSSDWFHQYVAAEGHAQTLLFPNGKTKFVRPNGTVGKEPGHGIVLIGMGRLANEALARCGQSGFGWFTDLTLRNGETA